jgi:large subunit ribosomal protein L22
MAKYNYSTKIEDNMASAVLRGAEISHKQSIEVCNHIRGRKLADAKKILNDAIALKKPIPVRRFGADRGHKPGMGPGRYSVNACTMILQIIESAEANAQFKGLETSNLIVSHINSHKASRPFRMGRNRGRKGKRANVEVVLAELPSEGKSKKKAEKKEVKAEVKADKAPKVEKETKPKAKKAEDKEN